MHGYSCSSVSLCSFLGIRTSLESSSDKPKVGLHTILHKLDYPEDILRQLRKMTVTHRVEMLKHCRPYVKESVKTGKWRCHWEWNDAVAKIVQRMQDIRAFRGSDVPLNCCPCQLGTSDARHRGNNWRPVWPGRCFFGLFGVNVMSLRSLFLQTLLR